MWFKSIFCFLINLSELILFIALDELKLIYIYSMLYKNTLGVKSEAKSEVPVTSIFCMPLKDVISGRGQGLLRFNHFVYAAIYTELCANKQEQCMWTNN